MIHLDAPLNKVLCIFLHNIFDMDNVVEVYYNSFDTSLSLWLYL